ncbi:hypothetical protein G9A89_016013 [Geosiphon pyriformis]|nr:hypothetical protein G9A89_016013 [Geosiphon pyriformis]
MNKVAVHIGILENEKANKLAKESTTLDTVKWIYNANETAYIPFCRGVELDLNIRHFLNKQIKGKILINDVKNKWIQCLLQAVGGGQKALNTNEKIVLSSEYIMSSSNIDMLCKRLVNKQFGRINAFANINLKTNNNILVKICKWTVTQARNKLWEEWCRLQTKWKKSKNIDNRVKRNSYDGSNIHNTSRDGGRNTSRHIVRIGELFT